jgi:hypothetical protein
MSLKTMFSHRSFVICFFAMIAAHAGKAAVAQDGPQAGVIKSVDVGKRTVTITYGNKEGEFKIAPSTQLMDASGKPIEQRLKDNRFKPDAPIYFKPQNDSNTLAGLKLRAADGKPQTVAGGPRAVVAKVDTSSFQTLAELGEEKYHGFQGGLYPAGANERPAEHEAAGRRLAAQVRPLHAGGEPDPNGKIVLLTIGMSNTSQASEAFKELADGDREKNSRLVIVNGAQGGMSADRIVDSDDGASGQRYWSIVDERLKQAKVTRQQVQAVWIKQAEPGPTEGFPAYARKLQRDLAKIVGVVAARFPNARLCYLSPRTYGGYARSPLNPEPYAYESGFSIKWLIEQQLQGEATLNFDPGKGPITAPWLSWGAYLWANGARPNADGLSYEPGDFAADGTHESPSGQRKVARQMLDFFKADATTKVWFLSA